MAACGRAPQPAPSASPSATPAPLPQGVPAFAGPPPARMILDDRPLDIDPDGNARWLVRAHFVDAQGAPTELLAGGDVAFAPSHGTAQWQTRLRFGGPAAIVSTVRDGPLSVRATAAVGPPIPSAEIGTDTRRWSVARIVARALGPHAVALGWFPRIDAGVVRVARTGGNGQAVATVPTPCSGLRDNDVAPGATYRYEIALPGREPAALSVTVPLEPKHATLDAFGGKGMWLSFSPSTRDADGYDKLEPAAILRQAKAAGLHSIVIRTTYGPFDEISPSAKATIDALIDAAATAGIAVVAWTVPRSTSFEDLAADVAAAYYETPSGNGFAALAVDLERGPYFLGDGAAGYAALGAYLRDLRAALGPNYPLVATVEDPNLEQLSRATYPYDAIAAAADALQPMVYWRIASARAVTPQAVQVVVDASYAATLREAGRALPIVVGLQSGAFGARGAPPQNEIAAAVATARRRGALGVTFFDWSDTPPGDWAAISAARW